MKRFIIIDDDAINNFLTKMILKKSFDSVKVNDFKIPEDGLKFIESETSINESDGKTIVFLDINMPTISGWDFLEAFELLNPAIKEHYTIYILSSSVDPSDINRARTNPLVKGFLEKPLKKEVILKIC
ncbi:response regulator containing a CheY-like receiver domain and an HTH DNA-binding domain [Aequorivita sublithincola DSM 14238]|uniref:Response regulator containing a CheY-like receiver domain and an HTH DNA-binding domain n=1 Tax=Aequorivita sublithincola (strain DSM 14238 / LMG 21431 / ACAM 643 / 9-3) TaxID=746697 RepID=I3YX86_AEQSU|nr:response regulator [Aequorivita sublithincola]AFL81604.1 response regulator containing a CheY-like receiver domain and an HTH DNA-binding domain [Aequorivita sublithincola DSM 14238]